MSAPAVSMNKPLPSLDYGVGAGVALLLAGLIGFALARAGSVPLQLHLYGELGYIDPMAVQGEALPLLDEGFFALDAQALENRLRALPWVADVQVERLWPDRLAVHLRSHEPLAGWGDAVLTRDGHLIYPRELPELSLSVTGPQSQRGAVVDDLGEVMPQLPADWRLLSWQVSPTGDRKARMRIEGHALELEFGREPVAEKFAVLAAQALPVLRPRLLDVAAIDLRYRNGFAVRWNGNAVSRDEEL